MREFTLEGFIAHLRTVPAAYVRATQHAQAAGAALIAEEARASLGHEDLLPPPLAQATQDTREAQGYAPTETGLRAGILRDHIDHSSAGNRAAVGVPHETVTHPYDHRPRDVGEIAIWFELGTDKQPPRALLAGASVRREEAVVDMIGEAAATALAGGL